MATAKTTTASNTTATKQSDPSDAAAIQEQLDAVRADISELTRIIGAYGQAQKEQLSASAHARAEKLKQDARDGLTEAELRARGAYDQAETAVRDNPAAALGIAAGLGFVLGLMSSRR